MIKMSISPCSLKTIHQPQAGKSEEQSCFSFSSPSFFLVVYDFVSVRGTDAAAVEGRDHIFFLHP